MPVRMDVRACVMQWRAFGQRCAELFSRMICTGLEPGISGSGCRRLIRFRQQTTCLAALGICLPGCWLYWFGASWWTVTWSAGGRVRASAW